MGKMRLFSALILWICLTVVILWFFGISDGFIFCVVLWIISVAAVLKLMNLHHEKFDPDEYDIRSRRDQRS